MTTKPANVAALLEKCHKVLLEGNHPKLAGIEFGKPVPAAKLKAWKKETGIELPPSFTRFLTERGSFNFIAHAKNRSYYATIPLASMVKESKRLTEPAEDEGLSDRLLAFQNNPQPGNAFVFDRATAQANGEMKVYGFYRDDVFDVGDGAVADNFEAHIAALVEEILGELRAPKQERLRAR